MIIEVISRWIELISLIFLAGTVLCRLWVIAPARSGYLNETAFPSMWRMFGPAICLMAAAATASLLARVAETRFISIIAAVNLFPVVVQMHIGRVWLIRISLLALLAIVFVGSRWKRREGRPALLAMLFIILLVSMTESAYGHAAYKGDFSAREIMDWLHLMGAMVWGGGLFVLSIFVLPRIVQAENEPALIAGIARRFSLMAGIAVGFIAITAAYNFSVYVGGYSGLIGTAYGLTVLAKTIPFIAILALGAFNRYVYVLLLDEWAGVPTLSRGLIDRFAARFFSLFINNRNGSNGNGYWIALRFKRLVRIEAFLVIAVLLCTSFLGYEVPLPVMHTRNWNLPEAKMLIASAEHEKSSFPNGRLGPESIKEQEFLK